MRALNVNGDSEIDRESSNPPRDGGREERLSLRDRGHTRASDRIPYVT